MLSRLRDTIPRPRALGAVLAALELLAVALVVAVLGAAWPAVVAAAVTAPLVAHAADLHRRRLVLSTLEDVPGLLVSAVATTAVLALAGAAPIVLVVLPLLAALVAVHAGVHLVARWRRRDGLGVRSVVVVGSGDAARHLAMTLLARPDLGLVPVGFVSASDPEPRLLRDLPLTLLGPLGSLPDTLTETRACAVLVALPDPAGPAELAAVHACLALGVDVHALPRLLGELAPGSGAAARDHIGEVSVVRLHPPDARRPTRALRRLAEITVSAVSLAVLLPLAAVLAVLVRIEAGGILVLVPSALDETVTVARFRTRRSHSLVRPGTTWSVAIPGRSGPVGRLLRRSRLDELPEVIGVLLRRLVGASGARGSATPAGAHQPQVDVGQLAG